MVCLIAYNLDTTCNLCNVAIPVKDRFTNPIGINNDGCGFGRGRRGKGKRGKWTLQSERGKELDTPPSSVAPDVLTPPF